MQSLKKIVANAVMMLALLFGLTVSAAATFEEVKKKAEQGDSFYQTVLGDYYSDGRGVHQDYAKAFYWHKKSADQGNDYGQFGMGEAYFTGQGVQQDYAKALQWFYKSANQNNNNAKGMIGYMYEHGMGVQQNKTTSKEWHDNACDNGSLIGGWISCDEYKRLDDQGY